MLTVKKKKKSAVSFPLENKHVVNEHHVIRKRLEFQCTT